MLNKSFYDYIYNDHNYCFKSRFFHNIDKIYNEDSENSNVKTLQGCRRLDDDIINTYFELIKKRNNKIVDCLVVKNFTVKLQKNVVRK